MVTIPDNVPATANWLEGIEKVIVFPFTEPATPPRDAMVAEVNPVPCTVTVVAGEFTGIDPGLTLVTVGGLADP